jgi:hypothetical protein
VGLCGELDNPRVASLFFDSLSKQGSGLLDLAQTGVGGAKIAERGPIAQTVANLANDDECLLVAPDGLFDVGQARVGASRPA